MDSRGRRPWSLVVTPKSAAMERAVVGHTCLFLFLLGSEAHQMPRGIPPQIYKKWLQAVQAYIVRDMEIQHSDLLREMTWCPASGNLSMGSLQLPASSEESQRTHRHVLPEGTHIQWLMEWGWSITVQPSLCHFNSRAPWRRLLLGLYFNLTSLQNVCYTVFQTMVPRKPKI